MQTNYSLVVKMNDNIRAISIALLTILTVGIVWASMRFAYILWGLKIIGIPVEFLLFGSLILTWLFLLTIASKDPRKNCHIYRTKDGDKYIKRW